MDEVVLVLEKESEAARLCPHYRWLCLVVIIFPGFLHLLPVRYLVVVELVLGHLVGSGYFVLHL